MSVLCKRILGIFLSVLCIATGTFVCCLICNHPLEETENTVASFYREPTGSLDVVTLGSSATGSAFYPPALWQQAGITSYCLHSLANYANTNISMLREILSTQPQAVILVDADTYNVELGSDSDHDAPVRVWIDSMRWSRNRIDTIRDLYPGTLSERWFPFARYHRNMTEFYVYLPLTADLLQKQIRHARDPARGALCLNQVCADGVTLLDITTIPAQPLEPWTEPLLTEFLTYCRQQGLQNVVFVDYPKAYSDADSEALMTLRGARVHDLQKKVEAYGYTLFSYNALGNPAELDTTTDFKDIIHVNASGAVKFSAYLAEYLQQTFAFSEKDAETIAQWDADSTLAMQQIGKD